MLKNALLWVGFFALLCFFVAPVMAQTKTLTGKVTDSKTGAPLAGVSIMPKGSKFAITTDTSGNFTIYVRPSTGILLAIYKGYVSLEIDVTRIRPLDVKLQKNAVALSEINVVSVGYDTLKQKDVASAATSINSINFNNGEIINPARQIQGKVAGLVVTMAGGDPNAIATIHLRGQTSVSGDQSPLFVVDGIALDDAAQFQNIPPEDIESYDILKDASATAIYGSRGANGVILVNIKKGSAGKPLIEYNGFVGVDKPSKYYDLLNADEYKKTIAPLETANSFDKGGNTDWQRAILRTAITQSNNLAVSGGNRELTYRASVNYQDNQGVVINSDKQQLGFRFNIEEKALNGRLDINAGIAYISTIHKYTNYNLFTDVLNALPTYPIYNSDGSYYDLTSANQANPVEKAKQPYNQAHEYQTLINGTIDYALLRYLKIGVTGSTTMHNTQTIFFDPQSDDNTASNGNFDQNYYNGNIHLDFDKKFGKHSLSVTGVCEYNNYTNDAFGVGSPQYLVPGNTIDNLGEGNTPDAYKEDYNIRSILGRLNYNYDETFYITAIFRRDASSNFGENNKWGNFPSLDVALRLKKLLFNDLDWIQDIKLRAGYGIVGNQNAIGPYSSEVLHGTTLYGPALNVNPDLKWEEKQGRNIGAEVSLFNNRLTAGVNLYSDLTTNFLYNYSVPAPPFLYSNVIANVGRLVNKGIEMSISADVAKSENFTWNISGNINIANTEITRISGTYDDYKLKAYKIPLGYALGPGLSTDPITFLKPHYAPYEFYLPHFTGVNAQGNELFDGKTLAQNQNPKKYYINPAEKFDYGLGNIFGYKNWSLSFFLRGVYGQKIFNNTLLDYETVSRLPNNNVIAGALTNGTRDNPIASDRWLENASYLRLDNASLGYSFKQIKGIPSLRVYVAANNVFVITKYRGLDPEVQIADSNQAYIDATYNGNGYYPKTRSFIIGANVSFR